MTVERVPGQVPGESSINERPGMLGRYPEQWKGRETFPGARWRAGDNSPCHDRGPLGQDRGQDEDADDAHDGGLTAVMRDHVEDPRDRSAPVGQAEEEAGEERAAA